MKYELKPWAFILLVLSAAQLLKADPPPQFATIYQFGGVNAIPGAGLTAGPGGKLFGTTYGGAASDGTGSIYELVPNGGGTYAFNTLYRFDTVYSPPSDGQYPYAGLTLSPDGTTLYGTTTQGGTNSVGVMFDLNIALAEGKAAPHFGNYDSYNVAFMFIAAKYGGGCISDLDIYDDPVTGNLVFVGEASDDGPYGDFGTVFMVMVSPTGQVSAYELYSFGSNFSDGKNPQGRLVMSGGPISPRAVSKAGNLNLSGTTFYGVTKSGGSNNWGTVYSVNGNGSNFMTLHHFSFSTSDGTGPMGGLVLSGNTLYGTTTGGGSNYGGTVFKINTDGSGFQVIENFDFATTGYSPQGDLILSGDTLYGTTYSGGTGGGGTVYSINTSCSNFMVLHSFTTPTADANGNYTNSDGGWSVAGLLLSGYTLYGTTPYGGTNGVGTAYEIMLPAPPALAVAPAGGGVKISWPSSATNFVLQQNSNLATTNWSTNSLAIANDGTNKSVIISSPPPASLFFRLKQ